MAYISKRYAFARKSTSVADGGHNPGFMIELVVLLFLLVVVGAILLWAISYTQKTNEQAKALSMAIVLTQNEAERFGVDPIDQPSVTYYDSEGNQVEDSNTAGFVVATAITSQTQSSSISSENTSQAMDANASAASNPNSLDDIGILYHAHIATYQDGAELYSVDTAVYLPQSREVQS